MSSAWERVESVPALGPGEIHLWRLPLDESDSGADDVVRVLSATEVERAARFRSPLHGRRWAGARGWLRHCLGGYLAEAPENIVLVKGENDKPVVEPVRGRCVNFNVSHSAGLALFGFCHELQVGVDVEALRSDLDVLAIAEIALGAGAAQSIASLPAERRAAEFARLWVRHEAAGKCTGSGLHDGRGEDHATLAVADVAVGEGVAAAVATTGTLETTRLYEPARLAL